MIQAIGLTSVPRKELPPALDNVSFEAASGRVTVLLGAPGAGKTTALRLVLALQHGRGITYFRGRPLHRIAHPSREVGAVLGDVPGHPARTVRGHLRMLCAAVGVPVRRADDVLEVLGIISLRDERLGTLSRGMDRRLGLACALLADPQTLVLDDPTDGLSAREARWLHGMLRAHAEQGGTVLFTTRGPKEAARDADRVVTLERGRLVADQEATEFSRTRLRPRVAVRSPHAARLGSLLTKEARTARRSVEVVREGGNRLSVYGSTCADVGETAFRHGILVHQLADEVGDMGPGGTETVDGVGARAEDGASVAPLERVAVPHTDDTRPEHTGDGPRAHGQPEGHHPRAVGTPATERAMAGTPVTETATRSRPGTTPSTRPTHASVPAPSGARSLRTAPSTTAPSSRRGIADAGGLPPLPPPITVRPARSPLQPLRYELRRISGVGTGYLTVAASLVTSVVLSVLLARVGHTPQPRLLAAWPRELPLPPAALGAGLLGAIAFGDEFRHPALAVDRGNVPRRLGLLAAKLLITSATALMLAFLTVGCDLEVLYLVHGPEVTGVSGDWFAMGASWIGLVVGCSWAGVLAAGVFRSTTAGLAAVLAVPVVVVPLVQEFLEGPAVRSAAGLSSRLREIPFMQWPFGGERHLETAAGLIAQPVGGALLLSLMILLGTYVFTTLRSRA